MSAVTSWRHVLILFFGGVAVSFQIGKVPGAVPLLKEELSLSLVAASWIVAIFSLIAASIGIAVGALADRMGHLRLAVGGMILSAAASIVGATAQGQVPLLATRAIEGLGFIITVISIPLLITAVTTQRDRNMAMGIWAAYMPLGTGAMLLFGAPLLGLFGWRILWLMTAAVILVAVPFVIVSGREATARLGRLERPKLADMRNVASRPGPLLLGLIFGLYAGQHLTLLGFLPLILVERNGMSEPAAAALVAVMVLSNGIGNAISGYLLRHGFAPRTMMLIGCLAMGISACFVYPDFPLAIRIAGAFVLTAIGGLVPAALFALSPVVAPRIQQLSSVNGLMLQGSAIGQLLMPPAVAALVTRFDDWALAGPAGLAFMLIAASAAVALTRPAPVQGEARTGA